jgi:uncharacterized membrane protein YhhN
MGSATNGRRDGRAQVALAAFAVLGAAYTVLVAFGQTPLTVAIKAVLMPTLLAWALVSLGRATPRLLIAALLFAAVGDVGLAFEATFLVGMAGFLAMQVCYVLGFLRLGAWPRLRGRWWIAAAYAAFWVVANLVLGPRLGDLQIPILVYSLALCTMAAVAAGVDRRVGVGGLLFLASDMLIGFQKADLDFAGRGTVVMVTYLIAQYLLVTGWARQVRPDVPIPV